MWDLHPEGDHGKGTPGGGELQRGFTCLGDVVVATWQGVPALEKSSVQQQLAVFCSLGFFLFMLVDAGCSFARHAEQAGSKWLKISCLDYI